MGGYLVGKGKLSRGCEEVMWWVWVGCLVGVWRLLEGEGRLSGRCAEAVWRLRKGYLEGVGRQSSGCGLSFWRVMGDRRVRGGMSGRCG